MRLQRPVDVLFGHGEHHDLVVGQQILFDSPGKGQAVELRPIGRRVVHGEHLDVVARRFRLRTLSVETRRGGHVEALRGADLLCVVNEHERRRLVAGALDAGGPMGFVAEDEIEFRRAVLLRTRHDGERVIGAEDHGHHVSPGIPQRLGNRCRIRGDRDFKFLDRCVLVIASGARIGANADIAMRNRLLHRPFPHRLGKQRYRRNEIQHTAPDARDRFRQAQRGKGLARTTGHDQLAAIVIFEAAGNIVERGLLMRPQTVRFMSEGQRFRLVADQIGPVEGRAEQIAEAKHRACRPEREDGLDRVRPPLVAGVDDDPCGERIASRRGDERIEMRFRNLRARRVTLALNGAVAARTLLCDQIDPRVSAIETALMLGPFGPPPDRGETLLVERILGEIRLHQPLEEAPLLDFGVGDGPYLVQRALKAVAQCAAPVALLLWGITAFRLLRIRHRAAPTMVLFVDACLSPLRIRGGQPWS